jgi:hypothetical protein
MASHARDVLQLLSSWGVKYAGDVPLFSVGLYGGKKK